MSNEDPIPELLASHELLTSTPEVWFDVSRGLSSPAQAAEELEALEDPALIERSKRLFAPPSAAQERAIRARALDVGAPSHRSRWWITGAFALAAAVILTFAARPPAEHQYAPLGVEYQLELSEGWHATRAGSGPAPSEDEALQTYRIDQRIDLTLRPSAALDQTELDVVMLAYDQHGRGLQVGPVHRLPTTKGTVRFSQELSTAGLHAGTWQLVLAIGRVGEVPEGPEHFAPGVVPASSVAVVRETIQVIDVDET